MPARKYFLALLFQYHGKELLAFAGQHSGGDNAEDLVQDAYLRMLQHPNPEALENPRAFLYKTLSNLSIDQHRKQTLRNRIHPPQGIEAEAELARVADPVSTPEAQLATRQELEHLDALLMELPELTRYAFVLYRLEGMSHQEVAQRLGISVRSSERRVAQAASHILSRFGHPE